MPRTTGGGGLEGSAPGPQDGTVLVRSRVNVAIWIVNDSYNKQNES